MYLKRSIYNQLLDWKKDSFHRILEVNGARQTGKTYIINRFAEAERAEGSIHKEIQELIARNDSPYISRDTYNRMLNWLYLSGITGFHGETMGTDTLDFKPADRCYCYFMDSGLAHYYLSLAGLDPILFLNTDE